MPGIQVVSTSSSVKIEFQIMDLNTYANITQCAKCVKKMQLYFKRLKLLLCFKMFFIIVPTLNTYIFLVKKQKAFWVIFAVFFLFSFLRSYFILSLCMFVLLEVLIYKSISRRFKRILELAKSHSIKISKYISITLQ